MGTTCSAKCLTDFDRKVIDLCKEISDKVKSLLPTKYQNQFYEEYGKIAYTRDSGSGRGGGKLERDAITTRGRTGKAPFSNRNLRWHPLVAASNAVPFAKEVERVEINEDNKLVFVVKLKNGELRKYRSDEVHELPERYVVTSDKWEPLKEKLKGWSQTEWDKNLCLIPSLECCEWYDSVETYAVLAISVACGLFEGNFNEIYNAVVDILKNQSIYTNGVKLPTPLFPRSEFDIICDPITKIRISESLDIFRKSARPKIWTPNWLTAKRDEGNDSSIQLMHLNPLIETEIRHRADNVRYGFRWSNVAMTDHSIEEAVDFFSYVSKVHRGEKND